MTFWSLSTAYQSSSPSPPRASFFSSASSVTISLCWLSHVLSATSFYFIVCVCLLFLSRLAWFQTRLWSAICILCVAEYTNTREYVCCSARELLLAMLRCPGWRWFVIANECDGPRRRRTTEIGTLAASLSEDSEWFESWNAISWRSLHSTTTASMLLLSSSSPIQIDWKKNEVICTIARSIEIDSSDDYVYISRTFSTSFYISLVYDGNGDLAEITGFAEFSFTRCVSACIVSSQLQHFVHFRLFHRTINKLYPAGLHLEYFRRNRTTFLLNSFSNIICVVVFVLSFICALTNGSCNLILSINIVMDTRNALARAWWADNRSVMGAMHWRMIWASLAWNRSGEVGIYIICIEMQFFLEAIILLFFFCQHNSPSYTHLFSFSFNLLGRYTI